MSKEQTPLNPEVLGQVRDALWQGFNNQQRTQFGQLSSRWEQNSRLTQTLASQSQTALTTAQENITFGEDQLTLVSQNFQRTRDFIYNPEKPRSWGRLSAMRGRAIVWLHLRSEHPWLTPITKDKEAVEDYLAKAREAAEEIKGKDNKKAEEAIRVAELTRSRTESQLFDLCEGVAVETWDRTISYVGAIPVRAHPLADRYGGMHYLDRGRVRNLNLGVMLSNFIEEQQRKGDRRYNNKTPVDLLSEPKLLSAHIKNVLIAGVSYSFLVDLADEGLISKPQPPDTLREFNL